MRFVDIQDEVKDLINFTAAADKDYSAAQIKKAINRRYEHELAMAQQQGGGLWFHVVQSFTWTASDVSMALPPGLQKAGIIAFEDITDSDPGTALPSEVFWLDHQTLQWGENGPSSDRTIRVTYMSRPVELVNDADEPMLIPPEFRMLLVWSAAVYLRQKADEAAPQDWKSELTQSRFDFWKAVARGRPYGGSGASISRWRDPSVSGAQVDQDGSSINQDNN